MRRARRSHRWTPLIGKTRNRRERCMRQGTLGCRRSWRRSSSRTCSASVTQKWTRCNSTTSQRSRRLMDSRKCLDLRPTRRFGSGARTRIKRNGLRTLTSAVGRQHLLYRFRYHPVGRSKYYLEVGADLVDLKLRQIFWILVLFYLWCMVVRVGSWAAEAELDKPGVDRGSKIHPTHYALILIIIIIIIIIMS